MGCGSDLNPVKQTKKAAKAIKKSVKQSTKLPRKLHDKMWEDHKSIGRDLERFRRKTDLGDMYMRSLRPVEMPEMPEETVIPDMDEEELRRARRRKQGSGAATILSEGNQDGLGG